MSEELVRVNPGRVTEMDNAVKGLANGNEPLYYRVW